MPVLTELWQNMNLSVIKCINKHTPACSNWNFGRIWTG